MLRGGNIQYDLAERAQGFAYGGLGAIQLLVRQIGLAQAIDEGLPLLKRHLPYHESDHVLNLAYNILCNGQCLEDLERLRQDAVYLEALGAQRIPDPTTAGDFCRRFREEDVIALMEIFNHLRVRIWRDQPPQFFQQAILDADGTIAETTGQCKEGMDISYNGRWGYHPLILSLANTGEPLYLVNRPGNCVSSQSAAGYFDRALDLCFSAGFHTVLMRGDTDFSQTEHLDRWAGRPGVQFIFGMDAKPNLIEIAEALASDAWQPLVRASGDPVATRPRPHPENVRQRIVKQRGYKNARLVAEHVAQFDYRPQKCTRPYRMVVLRKQFSLERGEQVLGEEIRYFFYLTHDRTRSRAEIVRLSNDRCNQENLIEQLKEGVRALRMPLNTLVSNWAYMVIASLAWTLKAWWALRLPTQGRWAARHTQEKETVLTMEFKRFRQAFLELPCQIVRTGRRLVYRLLAWNPWLPVFFRALRVLQARPG
jgi:hypothetical protein